MLSIIIATNKMDTLKNLEANIANTVGVVIEIIPVLNAHDTGLSAAYNYGARKAGFSYLCFVHDDVFFQTQNWGINLITWLNDAATGLVGIAGGRYKSAYGLGWRDGSLAHYRFSIVDGKEGGKHLYFNPQQEEKAVVLCIDGVFIGCKKLTWEANPFDEKNFKGFHFYDMDFSLQVNNTLTNYVVYNILITHFSQGLFDKKYIEDAARFEKKWIATLPLHIDNLSAAEVKKLEGYAVGNKLALMKKNRLHTSARWRILAKYMRQHKNLYFFFRSLYFGFIK